MLSGLKLNVLSKKELKSINGGTGQCAYCDSNQQVFYAPCPTADLTPPPCGFEFTFEITSDGTTCTITEHEPC